VTSKQGQPIRLQILSSGDTGPVITLRAPVVRIGRDPSCEVFIDDPAVSRVHCAIHCDGDNAMLVVGQSRNPAFINGIQAKNSGLSPGDVLSVCDHRIRFNPALLGQIAEGPNTLDHLGSRRRASATGDGEMPEISLDGLTSDSHSLDLEADDSMEMEEMELELELGRPDDEHTQILPRSATPQLKGRDEGEHTRVLPRGNAAPSQQGAEVVGRRTRTRPDDERTRILPRGGTPKPAPAAGSGHAVMLSDGAHSPQAPADEIDHERLSVAIQQAAGASDAPQEAQPGGAILKGPLANNGVRAAALFLMVALAVLAWKDTLFPGSELVATSPQYEPTDAPAVVGERAGRTDEQLIADAQKAFDIGSKRLEEHALQDENLSMAILQLSEADATLKLLNAPPALAGEVDLKLREAEDLREEKYRDALFHYQKLKRGGDYREGKKELEYILRLLADENDPRFKEAQRELLSIEESIKDRR